jgi:hypothetical protein
MKQTNKELLLQDLCARLPYGVKVESVFINLDTKEHKSCGIEVFDATSILMIRDGLGEFKPYLFPLSSMTEEQRKYIADRWGINEDFDFEIDPNWGEYFVDLCDAVDYINWLNENHFDYRGLIEKGLAIDATGLNIY